MKPSAHTFKPDARHPLECSVCGRARAAHIPDREKARDRAGSAAVDDGKHQWSPYQ